MRVLITVPNLNLPGGVTGLYNSLELEKLSGMKYFEVNFKRGSNSPISILIIFLKFLFTCPYFDIIHINPSFDRKSVLRDGILILISRLMRKKIVVYWHGWQSDFYDYCLNQNRYRFFFNCTYNKVDLQIVLSKLFQGNLKGIGYNGKIIIESNAVKKIETTPDYKSGLLSDTKTKVLFMSRIVKNKGWDIAILTFEHLQKYGRNDIELLICGDGPDLIEARELVLKKKLDNVKFLGHVSGQLKCELLLNSRIGFFPTCYPEGMPLTLLEYVVNGLPIVTRSEGGIPDHLVNGENGFILNSTDPQDFANIIIRLLEDDILYNRISLENRRAGQEKFTSEKFITRLLSYYEGL
jgi:glycosyltransferase involved in cell wall biosynthesis